ncbi:glycosyl transferase family 1 [Pseudorhizobium endolithicum]|uniref:Glycosyl transferase family 1 n=1 Tax=Pseudorhizobium endolithicum TaxID=1191678 RepID=A0ABM8PU36_9HYPH|nr:ABC transporter ATP-binding protein/permease [Pseudorhizobium endolithicum]CAD7048482.1 glycosyl transferase family 1 [Pseudorhizobium endolithicum]
MVSAFWHTPVRHRVLALAFSLLAIILATVYGQYRLNRWNIPFYNALERRDVEEFARQLGVFAAIAGSLLLLNVVQTWLNQITALYMREGLSRDLVDEWLKPQRALRLSKMRSLGDNPDQRLHEDARNLSELTTSLTIGLVNATILLVSFIGVLWSVSGDFSFQFNGTTFSVPGYMVWAALGYAGLASILSNIVGRRLPDLNAQRYSKEAELRFALMRTSENLTAITLARGEQNEMGRAQDAITTVLGVIRRLAIGYTHLTWVSSGFGWLSIVAPILIAAPVYFAGKLTFGGLMMTVGAFNQVYGALRWYVDNFRQIADWKATLQRVSTFRHALVSMEDVPAQGALVLTLSDEDSLSLKELELWASPPDTAHNHGLRLPANEVIRLGDRVMINGEAGADRRLLFQCLAGLGQWGRGQIALPRTGRTLFMPQVPYLPHASLREVLVYPLDPSRFEDERLAAALERVGLSLLTAALGLTERWDQKLSEGDQARLRLANVLVTEPKWLFMDDILEGLDADVQSEMAAVLSELENVTMIYIGLSAAFDRIVRPRHIDLQQIRTEVSASKD